MSDEPDQRPSADGEEDPELAALASEADKLLQELLAGEDASARRLLEQGVSTPGLASLARLPGPETQRTPSVTIVTAIARVLQVDAPAVNGLVEDALKGMPSADEDTLVRTVLRRLQAGTLGRGLVAEFATELLSEMSADGAPSDSDGTAKPGRDQE